MLIGTTKCFKFALLATPPPCDSAALRLRRCRCDPTQTEMLPTDATTRIETKERQPSPFPMPLPITENSAFSPLFLNFWLLRACCVLYITPSPPLVPTSLAIRNKKRHATWFFSLFFPLAQTTPAQQAGGTSPSVDLLVNFLVAKWWLSPNSSTREARASGKSKARRPSSMSQLGSSFRIRPEYSTVLPRRLLRAVLGVF